MIFIDYRYNLANIFYYLPFFHHLSALAGIRFGISGKTIKIFPYNAFGTCPLLGFCRQNLFLHTLGHRLVLLKEHGVITAALGLGAQICGVSEHFRKGNERSHHLTASDVIHALHTSAAGIQVSDHIAHIFFRHGDFHLHDRL